jgi:hypothetical protein
VLLSGVRTSSETEAPGDEANVAIDQWSITPPPAGIV